MNNHVISESITDFLGFVKAAEEQLHESMDILQETDLQIQDIEHALEICSTDAIQSAKLVKRLKEVRIRRREAKENIELCRPIFEWSKDNTNVIIALGKLSKKVRNVEYMQLNRVYSLRTTIIDDIIGNDGHLYSSQNFPVG